MGIDYDNNDDGDCDVAVPVKCDDGNEMLIITANI